jgi:hypothetical protein
MLIWFTLVGLDFGKGRDYTHAQASEEKVTKTVDDVHNGFSPIGRRIDDPFFDVVAEFTELPCAGRVESDLIPCGADKFSVFVIVQNRFLQTFVS